MLIRLRNCECTENDAKLLQTKTPFLVQRNLGKVIYEERFQDAIRLFPKKRDVFVYNFEKLLTANQNQNAVCQINAKMLMELRIYNQKMSLVWKIPYL